MNNNVFHDINDYRPARLCKGKYWYIAFNAIDPETKKMREKRIRVSHVKNKNDRAKYATELMKRINENLAKGWNPFVNYEHQKQYKTLSQAIDHFLTINEKKLKEDVIKENTYKDYCSYLKNFKNWVKQDIYVYKLNKTLISDFLEHIYLERNRSAQTRNNYLNNLRIFSGFLVEKDYLKFKPTDGLTNLKKGTKKRTVISSFDLKRLKEYLTKENELHYLLACELLFFTFIRPLEMSQLKIKDISFKNQTINLSSLITKNRKNDIVTLPKNIVDSFLDLKIYEYPNDFYIFSKNFIPGPDQTSSKQFRDKWLSIRKALKFPVSYQFYSLKDTGITNLMGILKDTRQVRDQARHSSIAITDIYTPHNSMVGNENIKRLDLSFE